MKHKRLAAAVLAAAVVLTGCGGAAAPAAPAGSGAASQSAADTVVQTAQKDRITEQFTLEKTIRDDYNITQKLNIHVPQLVCYSPDAAYLNDELAAMYAAEFRQYEDSPEIEPQQDEWCPETYINWDAYWYGDCEPCGVPLRRRLRPGVFPGLVLRFCHRKAGLRDRNAAAHGAGPGCRAAADAARGHADL